MRNKAAFTRGVVLRTKDTGGGLARISFLILDKKVQKVFPVRRFS
jgi:hypothetical protein